MTPSDWRAFGTLVGLSAVVGLALGVVWAATAPRAEATPGSDPLTPRFPMDAAFSAADLQLGAICIGAGVVIAALSLLTPAFSDGSDGALLGVLVGGLAGSGLAARIGAVVTGGSDVLLALHLGSPGVLLLWSLAGAMVGLAAGLRLRRREGRGPAARSLD